MNEGRCLTLPLLRQKCGDPRKATVLPLSGMRLEALEAVKLLAHPEKVRELSVSDNLLTSLAEVGPMTGLRRLKAAHNRLITVAGLDKCTELEELDLSDNSSRELRLAPLAALAKLRVLSLSGVPGPSLPRALLGHGVLTRLSLARCELAALPVLASLRRLEWLDVSCNLLSSLAAVAGLPRLARLDAANNVLREAALEAVPMLRTLDVRGNPLLTVFPQQEGLVVTRDEPEGQDKEKKEQQQGEDKKKKKKKKKTKTKAAAAAATDAASKGGKKKKRRVALDEDSVMRALAVSEAVDEW